MPCLLNLKPQRNKAFSFYSCICRELSSLRNIFPKSIFLGSYLEFGVGYFFPLLSCYLNATTIQRHSVCIFSFPRCQDCPSLLRIFQEYLSALMKMCFTSGPSLCVLNYGTNCLPDKFPHLWKCFPACSFQEGYSVIAMSPKHGIAYPDPQARG